MINSIHGDNIRVLRERQKLTQDELGEKLGISGKTVSSWENERSEPKMGMIKKMAFLFNCTISDIIDEKNNIERNYPVFNNAEDAMLFIIKNPIMMKYGGYDIHNMSDEELIETAQQIADYMSYVIKQKQKNR